MLAMFDPSERPGPLFESGTHENCDSRVADASETSANRRTFYTVSKGKSTKINLYANLMIAQVFVADRKQNNAATS